VSAVLVSWDTLGFPEQAIRRIKGLYKGLLGSVDE
jgi:hypothetical protein